jgi:LmbE family N-acetylglucosaminyl deacetylase
MLRLGTSRSTRNETAASAGPHLFSSKVLLIAAHPDDETIGAGALLSRADNIQVILATDGSPLNDADAKAAGFVTPNAYAAARRQEALCAMAIAGVTEKQLTGFQLRDQGLSFCLYELTVKILTALREHTPDILLAHAYEGGHPDHDSVAFACNMAHRIYRRDQIERSSTLYEFAAYNGVNGEFRVYEFLPCVNHAVYRYHLTEHEKELKTEMLKTFRSQAKTLEPFMNPKVELFRKPPEYDFRRPPHTGKLFYEYFDWGTDGHRWRNLAGNAEAKLRKRGELS